MSQLITSFLRNNGFNKKDELIYLDIFQHGQSFASSVSLRTGIDRTTVYSALKRLLKKGVIAQTKMNDVKAYLAVSPEIFMDSIERKINDLESEKKMAGLFVKEMTNLKKRAYVQPKIKIFEGDDAIINLYSQTLEKGGTQKSFLTLDSFPVGLKDFLTKQFIELKKRRKVFSRVLVAEGKRSERYKSLDSISNRETKIVKGHPFQLHAEIILFGGNQVAIIDFHQQIYGMVINSETFYKTVETLFDFVWGSGD
jgi:sugar-specific transcriptional regulator TrmB